MNSKTLQRTIMRRVYYAYTIAIASHRMFWQGVVLGACIALFGRLTHVASIVHNLLAVPVGNVPGFISDAFVHAAQSGEVLTILVSFGMMWLAVSVLYRMLTVLLQYLQHESARA